MQRHYFPCIGLHLFSGKIGTRRKYRNIWDDSFFHNLIFVIVGCIIFHFIKPTSIILIAIRRSGGYFYLYILVFGSLVAGVTVVGKRNISSFKFLFILLFDEIGRASCRERV